MKKYLRLIFYNFLVFIIFILGIEILSFLLLNSERKFRNITSSYEEDKFIGYKNTFDGFKNNANSPLWEIKDDNRILKRSNCNQNNNLKIYNFLISGGSTTDPLGTQHSGINGTWIDHFTKKFNNDMSCFNIYSVALAGYKSSDEKNAIKYSLSKIGNKKNFVVISFSGINDIYKDKSTNIEEKSLWYSYLSSYRLINKAIRVSNRFSINKKIKDNNTFNVLLDQNYLDEKSLLKNAYKWENNHREIFNFLNKRNISYFLFLQPTLGLDSNPIQLKNNIIESKFNPVRESLLAGVFDAGYFKSINLLYRDLRKSCSTMNFCIDKSTQKNLTSDLDLYHNWRHPNSIGNMIIADFIFKELNLKLKISSVK